jgi:hypothetical protein
VSACPVCRQRKGKRACPAKAADICSHCCGTKRRVEIDCPDDCVYLQGAHAPSWEGREAERRRDARRVAPHLDPLTETQTQLFLVALVGITGIRRARRDLDDQLLLQAAAALRRTVETRVGGLLYEHQADDLRAQGLVHDLKELFESVDEEGRPVTPDDRDLLAALSALEAAVQTTVEETVGSTAFLDTAGRLAGQLGAAARARPRPRIIEP